MKRLLAATVIAAATLALPAAAHASDPPIPAPGGTCDAPIDVMCHRPCTDELDCGLIPPCVLWVGWACVIGG